MNPLIDKYQENFPQISIDDIEIVDITEWYDGPLGGVAKYQNKNYFFCFLKEVRDPKWQYHFGLFDVGDEILDKLMASVRNEHAGYNEIYEPLCGDNLEANFTMIGWYST